MAQRPQPASHPKSHRPSVPTIQVRFPPGRSVYRHMPASRRQPDAAWPYRLLAAPLRFGLLLRPRRPVAGWVLLGLVLAGIGIAGVALVQAVEQPTAPEQWGPFAFEVDPHRMFDHDKFVHFVVCGLLSAGMLVGLHHAMWMTRLRSAATAFVLVGLVFSATTELVQGWLTVRSAQLFDLVANVAGTLAGLALVLLLHGLATWIGRTRGREATSAFAARQ